LAEKKQIDEDNRKAEAQKAQKKKEEELAAASK
jgi:hypothetical protein